MHINRIKWFIGRIFEKLSYLFLPKNGYDQTIVHIRNSKYIAFGKREYDLGEYQLYVPGELANKEILLEAIRTGAFTVHGDGYELSVQERYFDSGASMSSLEYGLILFQYVSDASKVLELILLGKLVGRFVDRHCPVNSAQKTPEQLIADARERLKQSFSVDDTELVSPALTYEKTDVLVTFRGKRTYVYHRTPNGVEGVFWQVNESDIKN